MKHQNPTSYTKYFAMCAAIPILLLLTLPIGALVASTTPSGIAHALKDPMFAPALLLSVQTSLVGLILTVLMGTPLAWVIAASSKKTQRLLSLIVDLPIVLPPAVVGISLLYVLGIKGFLGQHLHYFGLSIPFSSAAVVLAQVSVSSPFYIQAAQNAFKRINPELILMAQTLGYSPFKVFLKVILPLSAPGLISGAAMALARSLGEFGATLLFAGNLPGTTQTVPLAIYTALESDIEVAMAFSLFLVICTIVLLAVLKSSHHFNDLLYKEKQS